MSEPRGPYETGDAAERMLRARARGDRRPEGERSRPGTRGDGGGADLWRRELVLRGLLNGLAQAGAEFGDVPEVIRAIEWAAAALGRVQLARSRTAAGEGR